MKPVDPRLFRYAKSTRTFFFAAIGVGTLTAVVVIVQARLLSNIIVDVTAENQVLADVIFAIIALGGVFLARAALVWAAEAFAVRASGAAKTQLRQAAMEAVINRGLSNSNVKSSDIAIIATRGIDALDSYFARYLPQLVLAVIVPIAVTVMILTQDLLSAIIVAVTVPLIPLFMVLIGLFTRSKVDRQWQTLSSLSGHFLDLISGLPTLKIFGRAQNQVAIIKRVGDEYRSSTMGVLRISFLSSLVLELLASLSVALVAVSVGLRLAEGQIDYRVGLFVLLLAPEVYLPLRLIGQHFHAAAEGLGAADKLFSIIEQGPLVPGGTWPVPANFEIDVSELEVRYDHREDSDVLALHRTTFTARPGEITAIVGLSGSGKTTLLRALVGLVAPASGSINIRDLVENNRTNLAELDLYQWRAGIGWLPQDPHLFSHDLDSTPTIRSVIDLRGQFTDAQVWDALSQAEVATEIRPLGLDFTLNASGAGLSGGQLQRIALARALITNPKILILDEPTAALDSSSEQSIARGLQRIAAGGVMVIVVAHRPALMEIAHQIVRVGSGAPVPELLKTRDINAVIPTGSRNW